MHGFSGFGGFRGFRDLQVAVPLPDGQWLSFATALPESGPTFSRQFLLSMGIMAIVIRRGVGVGGAPCDGAACRACRQQPNGSAMT